MPRPLTRRRALLAASALSIAGLTACDTTDAEDTELDPAPQGEVVEPGTEPEDESVADPEGGAGGERDARPQVGDDGADLGGEDGSGGAGGGADGFGGDGADGGSGGADGG
jgi:hypothetical protein